MSEPGLTATRVARAIDAPTRDGITSHEAAIALLSRFIELPILLIGETLMLGLLREVAPEAVDACVNDDAA